MSNVTALRLLPEPSAYSVRLRRVIEELEQLEADLVAARLDEEADSVATVTADLGWQCEALRS